MPEASTTCFGSGPPRIPNVPVSPSAQTDLKRQRVTVPMVAAKLALHDAMLATGVSNVELARRLCLEKKAVRRLRDPLHRGHTGQIETAWRLLGKRSQVRVLAAI